MNDKEFPEPVEALVLILLSFGFIFAITVIITLAALLFNTESVLEGSASILFIIGGVIFLIVPIAYSRIRNYNSNALLRLKLPPNEVLLLSVPLGLSLGVLTDELDRIVQIFLPTPEIFLQYLESLRADTALDWLLLVMGVVVIASISEEILFRGFLQVALGNVIHPWIALALVSVLFGLAHYVSLSYAIIVGLLGFYMGALLLVTGNLFVAIAVHALYDFAVLLLISRMMLSPATEPEVYQ